MNETRENRIICECCGAEIEAGEDYSMIGEHIVCMVCVDENCGRCESCGDLIYTENAVSDDSHFLCQDCYDDDYTRCDCCDRIIRNANAYYSDDSDYCFDCYEKRNDAIREYSYKPIPIFYGKGKCFFGVELEIDKGGREKDYAQELLDIANHCAEHIYIKSDGSLDDGMEIVTHPMTLEYHLDEFCWEDILHHAVYLGYRSHQTSTCGLHVHVSRNGLGDTDSQQEDTISRILYFVEAHWNELLKFSRRSEYSMNRWAARHGYEHDPKKILDKAKINYNRYSAVNLCNRNTVEFRLFRGTLKINTLQATLQLVNRICTAAVRLSDEELQSLSWSEFVSDISEPQLIQYLKERRLYVNEIVNNEEEL